MCVDLRKRGVGAEVHHAAVISLEHEELLWSSGVLGVDTPLSLLRAAFYMVGLHFCLRGGQEHRNLRVEQLTRFPSDGSYCEGAYYQYVENGSKNHQGRFAEVGQENKVVRCYAQLDSSRCPVLILDRYLSKLPPNPPAFYMQWLVKTPIDSSRPWYKSTPVGVNPLKSMMPKMSELASLPVRYTNHSLRATATTRMFAAGVPEKIVAEVSGHKSVKALRQYERTSLEQEQATGLAISGLEKFESPAIREQFGSSTPDVKPSFEKKNIASAVEKLMPTVSGQLSNCTFNFNFN